MATSRAHGRHETEREPGRQDEDARTELRGREPASVRGYWLRHSQGFRVDGVGGRIGFVEEIRADGQILAVRAGLLGRRLLLFPAEAAAVILPQARRIWLRSDASIIGSETDTSLGAGSRGTASA